MEYFDFILKRIGIVLKKKQLKQGSIWKFIGVKSKKNVIMNLKNNEIHGEKLVYYSTEQFSNKNITLLEMKTLID